MVRNSVIIYININIYIYIYTYKKCCLKRPQDAIREVFIFPGGLDFFLFPECVLKGSCVLGRRSGGGALFAARCVFAAFKCVLPCL